MSEWRAGGYEEWRILHEFLDETRVLSENAGDIRDTGIFSDHLHIVLLAHHAHLLQNLGIMPEDEYKTSAPGTPSSPGPRSAQNAAPPLSVPAKKSAPSALPLSGRIQPDSPVSGLSKIGWIQSDQAQTSKRRAHAPALHPSSQVLAFDTHCE